MRILFTGATGVLGTEALPMILESVDDVTVVTRTEPEVERLRALGVRPVTIDLFDRDAVMAAARGMDTIVHFATAIPPQAAMTKRESWAMNDRLRSEATSNLVDAAIHRSAERFIQQSVTFAYADGRDRWLDEDSSIEPVWDVLDSALTAEAHVDRFRATGGVGVVLRLARLYGPGRASGDYIESVRNRKMPVLGNGANYVSSLHSHDAGTALVAALTVRDGTYNVTDDQPVPASDFVGSLAQVLGAPSPRRVPAALGRLIVGKAAGLLTISHRVSNERFKKATGWEPEYQSVADGWAAIAHDRQE
ncbi:MAG: NAD(P)-dependent oxidoreductase [Acidimicrobiia bacterium]|jgi:nucleoside-diphosphate-sugar epimerase